MKKLIKRMIPLCLAFTLIFAVPVHAADTDVYIVQKGDSLWKISLKYQVGISEIISANPQFKNPSLIYPGDKVTVPLFTEVKSIEAQVLSLTNAERAKNGLPALTMNWQLARVARYKSQDMIDKKYFAHQSPTYGSPFDMIEAFGIRFTAAAENIAYGQKTPAEVMNSWMNSPGHRSNILSGNVSQIGVGAAKTANGTYYWTQMFIRPA